jgi:hypothetical protein
MDVPLLVPRIPSIVCGCILISVCSAIAVGSDSVPQITVEAQRNHEKLKQDLDFFVSSAIVAPLNYEDTLWRWNTKICPLVAGMNKSQGEFVLARLSTIIRSVGAPLGPEKCKPNFYIVVVQDPEALLQKWRYRDVDLFDGESGADVNRFLETPRPVRVWYSAGTVGADGAFVTGLMDSLSIRNHPFRNEPMANIQPSFKGSRLTTTSTGDILSVIVVVDSTKLGNINFGQLTDYIGFIGLAQINLDKPLGDVPSILQLFTVNDDSRPAAMTAWDRALLHGLYSTEQRSRVQKSQIETVALRDIESNGAE